MKLLVKTQSVLLLHGRRLLHSSLQWLKSCDCAPNMNVSTNHHLQAIIGMHWCLQIHFDFGPSGEVTCTEDDRNPPLTVHGLWQDHKQAHEIVAEWGNQFMPATSRRSQLCHR